MLWSVSLKVIWLARPQIIKLWGLHKADVAIFASQPASQGSKSLRSWFFLCWWHFFWRRWFEGSRQKLDDVDQTNSYWLTRKLNTNCLSGNVISDGSSLACFKSNEQKVSYNETSQLFYQAAAAGQPDEFQRKMEETKKSYSAKRQVRILLWWSHQLLRFLIQRFFKGDLNLGSLVRQPSLSRSDLAREVGNMTNLTWEK